MEMDNIPLLQNFQADPDFKEAVDLKEKLKQKLTRYVRKVTYVHIWPIVLSIRRSDQVIQLATNFAQVN